MEENKSGRSEQMEALRVLDGFNGRLVGNMNTIIDELRNGRREDTDQFFQDIVNCVNWEIGVMNGTLSLLNEGEVRVDRERFNSRIMDFGQTIQSGDDKQKAESIRLLIPEFENLGKAIRDVLETE